MNYRQAQLVLKIIIVLALLTPAVWVGCRHLHLPLQSSAPEANDDSKIITLSSEHEEPTVPVLKLRGQHTVYDFDKQFNDLNPEHLAFAQNIGIQPIEGIEGLLMRRLPLVRVNSSDSLEVAQLTHSYPYLVEPAAQLLGDIGAEFRARLQAQNGGDYRLKATSLLRTPESVKRLRRGNGNATENSAHLYGTTFDISYNDFPCPDTNQVRHSEVELKRLLGEILLDFREQGRCMVKYERKQACFHITATGQ